MRENGDCIGIDHKLIKIKRHDFNDGKQHADDSGGLCELCYKIIKLMKDYDFKEVPYNGGNPDYSKKQIVIYKKS